VASPDPPSKHPRMDLTTSNSLATGCRKAITSSVYKKILYGTTLRFSSYKSSFLSAA
jgi:hypothetical protein